MRSWQASKYKFQNKAMFNLVFEVTEREIHANKDWAFLISYRVKFKVPDKNEEFGKFL